MSVQPRDALARRLRELVVLHDADALVAQAPIRQAAPPLIVLAPGTPYQRPTPTAPDCEASWRIDAWCITTREDINAQDTLDALAALVREAGEANDWREIDGMECAWLGIERGLVDTTDLAGIPGLGAIAQLRIDA
jgi:hypothetical protein